VVLTPEEKKAIEAVGEAAKADDPSMPGRVAVYIAEITTGVPAKPSA
jgi:hypothetical protein